MTITNLKNRIAIIADDYVKFTGKDQKWIKQLSFGEYAELRRQAIYEEQEGICYKDQIADLEFLENQNCEKKAAISSLIAENDKSESFMSANILEEKKSIST